MLFKCEGGRRLFFNCFNPKEYPQKILNYKPICLIGCMYKVLAKLLTNKMRKVRHQVI